MAKAELTEKEMKAKADIVVTRSEVEEAKAKVTKTKEKIDKVWAGAEELEGEASLQYSPVFPSLPFISNYSPFFPLIVHEPSNLLFLQISRSTR